MGVENISGRPQVVEPVLKEKTTEAGSGISGGWVETETPGVYTTRKPHGTFISPEYAAFAERSRASWDLFTYIKVLWKQHRSRSGR